MNTVHSIQFALARHTGRTLVRRLCLLAAAVVTFPAALPAQSPAGTPPPGIPAPANANAAADSERGRRGNFNPADIQARMLAGLRNQFAVTDDAEWSLISERITRVFDLRRNAAAGGAAFFNSRAGRFGRGAPADPAFDALKAAVSENLPDAEIKARLARLREERKQNEARLDQAREELRAVLTVRQEAVAVMTGLLN